MIPENEKLDLLFAATHHRPPPGRVPPAHWRREVPRVSQLPLWRGRRGSPGVRGRGGGAEGERAPYSDPRPARRAGGLPAHLRRRDDRPPDAVQRPEGDMPTATRSLSRKRRSSTYWLFKYRVEHSEKARVASDTGKPWPGCSVSGTPAPRRDPHRRRRCNSCLAERNDR